MSEQLFQAFIETYKKVSESFGDVLISLKNNVAVFDSMSDQNEVLTYLPIWSDSISTYTGVDGCAIEQQLYGETSYRFLLQDPQGVFVEFRVDPNGPDEWCIGFGFFRHTGGVVHRYEQEYIQRFPPIQQLEKWVSTVLPNEKPFRLPLVTGVWMFTKDYE